MFARGGIREREGTSIRLMFGCCILDATVFNFCSIRMNSGFPSTPTHPTHPCWFVGFCLFGCLVVCFSWVVGFSVLGCLVGWLAGWLVGWLAGWLVGWLVVCLLVVVVGCFLSVAGALGRTCPSPPFKF